jgi:phosphoglycolate phosphatase-like HAD superfamily hydrolase
LKNLFNYKCAIFDCDGVILQSNEIKTKAFAETLRDEPVNLVKDFIKYHKINGGISRYIKFEYYFRNLKKEKNFSEMTNKAINTYAKIIQKQLELVDYIPGCISIINSFKKNNIPCFTISGGDMNELHSIFKARGIFNMFKQILGSPISKEQHIKSLILDNQILKPAIFFGDSYSDMHAAINNNIDFCFVKEFSEWKDGEQVMKKLNFRTINNFNDLL